MSHFHRFISRLTPPLVGLDICQSEVSMVELSQARGGQLHLKHYARARLPEGAVSANGIEQLPEVVETVRHVWHTSGSTAKRVALCIPSHSAFTCIIEVEVDGRGKDPINKLVRQHAALALPYALDQALLDFSLIGPSHSKSKRKKVLIVAARRETVEDRIAVAESLGLKAMMVDIAGYALLCALQRSHGQPDTTPPMIVLSPDTGGVHAALIDHGSIVGDQFTVIPNDAMQHQPRREYYHRQPEQEAAEARHPQHSQLPPMSPMRETHHADIATHCALAVQALRARLPHIDSLAAIRLAGPGAAIPGLIKAIEAQTGIPTAKVAPFTGMSIAATIDPQQLAADAPACAVACGLALRRFD